MSTYNHKRVLEEMSLTNITPLVLTGVEPEHQRSMEALAYEVAYLPRRLILVGNSMVISRAPLQRKTTELGMVDEMEMASWPMEAIGTAILRQFTRGQKYGK